MALSVGACLNGNNQPAVAIRANQVAMQAIASRQTFADAQGELQGVFASLNAIAIWLRKRLQNQWS